MTSPTTSQGAAAPQLDQLSQLELASIADEAAELGLPGPPPEVRRATLGSLSALVWADGPADIALLHGAALNAHTWDGAILAWGVPAVAFDLPGHGHSPWREDADYSPAALAPALAEATAQAINQGLLRAGATLVGHSLGGLAATHAAGRLRPGDLANLILVDILPPAPPGRPAAGGADGAAQDGVSLIASFLDGPASFPTREAIAQRAAALGFGGSPTALRRSIALNTKELPDGRIVWRHHLGNLGAPVQFDLGDASAAWAELAGVPAALSLVYGSRGFVGQAGLDQLARLRPEASLRLIESGHNIQEENPVGLARALAELSGVAQASRTEAG
jgi:pimeloyl-ACP methyl ester carboxylesterase